MKSRISQLKPHRQQPCTQSYSHLRQRLQQQLEANIYKLNNNENNNQAHNNIYAYNKNDANINNHTYAPNNNDNNNAHINSETDNSVDLKQHRQQLHLHLQHRH